MKQISFEDFHWLDLGPFKFDDSLTWRQNYERYLESPTWKNRRAVVIGLAENCCQRCGLSFQFASRHARGLEVHHKTYERLGNELLEDLEALCQPCHKQADLEREVESEWRRTNALENARFEGWAKKVDPYSDQDPAELWGRYADWRERKDAQDEW